MTSADAERDHRLDELSQTLAELIRRLLALRARVYAPLATSALDAAIARVRSWEGWEGLDVPLALRPVLAVILAAEADIAGAPPEPGAEVIIHSFFDAPDAPGAKS